METTIYYNGTEYIWDVYDIDKNHVGWFPSSSGIFIDLETGIEYDANITPIKNEGKTYKLLTKSELKKRNAAKVNSKNVTIGDRKIHQKTE
jgi:hypothetical protein